MPDSVRRGLAEGYGADALSSEDAESGESERQQQQQTRLRLLQQRAVDDDGDGARCGLPTLATAGDVREVVQYLKKKPEGVSVLEAVEDVRRRIFEPRKVAAYEMWGLVERRNARLLLTPLGREFARRLEPESEAYRALLRRTEAYHAALLWMRRQHADIITHTEVCAFWQQLFGAEAHAQTNEGHVVCFFHLCQAAQLGAVTVGKRGQPARLRIDREELADYLETEGERASAEAPAAAAESDARPARPHTFGDDEETRPAAAGGALRIFVSAGRASALAAQVETTLAIAGDVCEVFTRGDADSLLPPEQQARAMREADAAVFVVSSEDYRPDESGEHVIRQALLIQIAVAVILYDGRVALLCETGCCVPPSLSGLRRFAFADDVLTWEVGIGLLKAAKEFQTGTSRAA
ncbi:MAG TPA: hypothetical protein VF240_16635 [Pyrinomonadaceae bacterium]